MHGSEVSGKVCPMQGCVVHRSPWKHWPGYVSPRRMACLWKPVFGVSGFCSRKVLVNQVIKHRQVKQFVAALRVTLLPTLLMPETKKTLSWLILLRKASKMCFILAASLIPAMPSFLQQQQQGSHADLPLSRALFFPGQEQPGSQPLAAGFACADEMIWANISRVNISTQCYSEPCTWYTSVWKKLYCAMQRRALKDTKS